LLHTTSSPLQAWQLESVSLLRKYSGLVDVIWSMLLARPLQHAVAVSGNPFVSYRAMQAHHSQFVWFRHLFVIFSRYTFINTLVPMNADDPAVRLKKLA
jgi:N-acetylglucosaminylphosphatidylinositol deacetylase